MVSFNPLDGSTSVVFTCPTGAALSFYTGLVITNNNGQDVLLFPLLLANGWAMVALTTTGRALWSALVYRMYITARYLGFFFFFGLINPFVCSCAFASCGFQRWFSSLFADSTFHRCNDHCNRHSNWRFKVCFFFRLFFSSLTRKFIISWNVSLQAFAASEQNTLQLFADNDGAVYAATLRGHNYQYYNVSLWRLNQETGQEVLVSR